MIVLTRPDKTYRNVTNGTLTATISPWVNAGAGTGWTYNSNNARCVITSGNSRLFRQPFKAKSGMTYSYALSVNISSVGSFSLKMIFMGATTQQIMSDGTLADGAENYSGTVMANADYDWVAIQVTENIP